MRSDSGNSRPDDEARRLASAKAEIEHEIRRVRDRLERAGGRSHALQTELARLEEARTLTLDDLARLGREDVEKPDRSRG